MDSGLHLRFVRKSVVIGKMAESDRMLDILAFDFPESSVNAPSPNQSEFVACTGTAWLLADADGDQDTMDGLLADEPGYKRFYVASGNGRRTVVEGDLLIVIDPDRVGQFRLGVYGAGAEDEEELRSLVSEGFRLRSVCLAGNVPMDTLAIGMSPFGRRRKRRQGSRTMLERTFDSLQCKEILGNPYLKERLSRTILDAAPKPIDPLLDAIFSRVRADGLLAVKSKTERETAKAASLYALAQISFDRLGLVTQSNECRRRLRIVHRLAQSSGQKRLFDSDSDPAGMKADDRKREENGSLADLGFVAKRCVAARLEFDDVRIKQLKFRKRSRGTSQAVASVLEVDHGDLLSLLERLDDRTPVPIVRTSEVTKEHDELTFDLEVSIRQRFGATLGLDLPLRIEPTQPHGGPWGVHGKTCKQISRPTELDGKGNAKVRLAATRTGRHQVQLRLCEGLFTRQFPISFQIGLTS